MTAAGLKHVVHIRAILANDSLLADFLDNFSNTVFVPAFLVGDP